MMPPKYILCIETGTDTCSVALAADGRLIALRESHGERDHAARVAVYTDEVLAEAGLAASDLSAVAVSKGPGSYTGLRIGVSFAKGLCYGLGIPLVGVGSLDSLRHMAMKIMSVSEEKNCFSQKSPDARLATEPNEAHTEAYVTNSATSVTQQTGIFHGNQTIFIPMIDARRMEVYCQIFDSDGKAITSPEALIIDEGSLADYRGRNVYIFGSGAEKCREALPWARYIDVEPSARGMIALATAAFEQKNFEDTAYFEPFYLKDFVITTSKKRLF